jgi:putative aminopeptidase FrvX
MEHTMIETIRTLVESYGPSGHEDQIRETILGLIDGLADEVHVDNMGSVIAWKWADDDSAPTVMLSAHMDEIGMMVTHITEDGFLRFTNIGGLFRNTLHGQRVRFADGTIGTIGTDSDVSSYQTGSMDQFYIDVSGNGAKPKVGDAAGLLREFEERGDRLIAKSMDDRIGCAIQVEVMKALKGVDLPNNVAFVFSTQEEVGLRGAKTAAYAVDPDIGIALDVTRTGDTPKGLKMEVKLGGGPAIKVKDSGMLAAPEVIDLMEKAAKKAKVSTQREVLEAGTTDAASMQLVRAGVRAGCLSIPCRYIHTTSETVDRGDVEGCIKLLVTLLKDKVNGKPQNP